MNRSDQLLQYIYICNKVSSTYGSSTLLPDFYDDTDCLIKSETSTPCHRLQRELENSGGIGTRLLASRYYFK